LCTAVWLAFIALHGLAGAWSWSGAGWLAPVVAATIYLPLWHFAHAGLPVFRATAWFFAPPTALGWTVAVAFWLLAWWLVAALVSRLAHGRRSGK
jgi:hypothetical protein